MTGLSKVSRDALEALARECLTPGSVYAREFPEHPIMARIRAEAAGAPEPDAPRSPSLRPEFIAPGEALGMGRPRTTDLLCYEGDCAKMTGRARPCPIHDATTCPHCWRDSSRCGCSLLDDAQKPEPTPPQRTRADDFRTMLREMAQSWRDEAFGGQHVSELRSNILEECADELTAAIDRPDGKPDAPPAVTEAEKHLLAAVDKLTHEERLIVAKDSHLGLCWLGQLLLRRAAARGTEDSNG